MLFKRIHRRSVETRLSCQGDERFSYRFYAMLFQPCGRQTGLAFLARTCQVRNAMNHGTWSHLEAIRTLLTVAREIGQRGHYDKALAGSGQNIWPYILLNLLQYFLI